ncbi:MAG: WG repeat-containing protein [Bacteroidia bacterium]|nr:WG repeat-containing protein [Bacteroidia bacterium]
MAEQAENINKESKESKRVNFWLNIFSKRPVYIFFSIVIVTLFSVLGYSVVNCWIKTKNFGEMLNCMSGGSYKIATDFIESDSTEVEQGDVVFWEDKSNSRFDLPEGQVIDEDITDLRAYWYQRYGSLLKLLIVVFLLSFLVFYEIYKYYRRRFFYKLEDEEQVGYMYSIKASSEDLELYKESDFMEATRQLRNLQPDENNAFPFSFLILIEKIDSNDHLAILYDQMLMELTQQNIPYKRYFFEGDPRLVYKVKYKEEYHFDHLKENYADNKLIIVAQTETFFDAVSGELDSWTNMVQPWEDLIIMTPKVPLDWSSKELALSKKFNLLPANLEGIKTVKDYLTQNKRVRLKHWIDNNIYPASPDLKSPELVQELKAYFDTYYEGREEHYEEGKGQNIFKWLCATAVYAELSWDMTLSLGHALEGIIETPLVTPRNLYIMSSLQWFREGKIPDEARAQLIEQLDDKSIKLTRETIIRLLKENEPLEGTFAYSLHQIRLAVQEAELKPNIRKHLKIVQMVQDFTLNHELTDPTVLNYLNRYPRQLPNVNIPSNVTKAIFESGSPALGIQTWVRVMLGGAFVLLILFTLDPSRLDKVYRFQNRDYYIANDDSWMRFHAYKGNMYLTEGRYQEAKDEYEMSLAYRDAIEKDDYLIAEYNLNLLKLKEGRRDEAESGFNTVSNKLDQLLADNIQPEPIEQKVRDVKSATDYIRGKLDYEAGDLDGAEDNFSETLQNNTTRVTKEANFGNALILVEKGLKEKGIAQENKIRLALTKLEDVALTDSNFFQGQSQVLSVLDSLADSTNNTRLKSLITQSVRKLRNQPPLENLPDETVNPPQPGPEKKGIIIEEKFIYLSDFSEDLALVKTNEGVAFADTNGNLGSQQFFEDARLFEEGLAAVKKKGRWGFINKKFETVIPFRYVNARDFQEGFASVKGKKSWGLIDSTGKTVLRFRYERPIIFDYKGTRPAGAEALAVIKRGEGYQFINRKGKVAFEGATFKFARNFKGETARVKRWRNVYEIDREGNCVPTSTSNGQCPGERWSITKRNEFSSHTGEIFATHFSSDGKYIITASGDSTAKLWGAKTAQLITTLNHNAPVKEAIFSPQNRLIATISGGKVLYIWTREGALVKRFDIARNELQSIAWSPNGSWLAAGGKDGKIFLYNMRSMVLANIFNTRIKEIQALCFSPNSKRIAAGGIQSELEVWSISGQLFKKIPFDGQIISLDYAPNRPEVAIASRDSAAYIIDVIQGKSSRIEGHSDWITGIEYSTDGKYLMTSSMDKSMRVWNRDDSNVFAVRKTGAVRSASLSPDGERVSLSFYDPQKGGKTVIYTVSKF